MLSDKRRITMSLDPRALQSSRALRDIELVNGLPKIGVRLQAVGVGRPAPRLGNDSTRFVDKSLAVRSNVQQPKRDQSKDASR